PRNGTRAQKEPAAVRGLPARSDAPLPRSLLALGVAEREPGAVLLAALDALGDEQHALDAVVDVRVDRVHRLELLLAGPLDHRVEGRVVDVGERLQVTLGVAAGDARGPLSRLSQVRPAGPGVDLVRFAVLAHEHLVRVLLVPLQ